MLFQELLEGEPDGGNAPVVVAGPPASDPVPPVSEPEGEPTPVAEPVQPEGTPPAEQEAPEPSADLTPEDRKAILEALRDSDEYRELVAQDAPKAPPEPKPERVRAQDPFFSAVTTQANESYQRIDSATKKLLNGELESVDGLLADIAVTGAWQAASERRGHIAVNRAVVERALGVEDGRLIEGNELHDQYDKLLTSLETAQQNAFRLRGQAVREYDPTKRSDILTRAEVMDAHAVGDFYRQTIDLAVAKGKTDGKAEAEKGFSKRAPAIAEKARANGQTEAIAKARQAIAAGKAMASGSVKGKAAPGELDRNALRNGGWRQASQAMRDAGWNI